jgi:type II secretory ATPase GspE/PulE/Tfp pilus assembly ATPase PilB-like protein
LLLVTDRVRGQLLGSRDAAAVRRAAVDEGMPSLLEDGARQVLEGRTTVAEVLANR